jgi:hypothetical protein
MENLGCITNPNMTFSKFYNPSENLVIDEAVQRKGDCDTIYSQETTIPTPKFTNFATQQVT